MDHKKVALNNTSNGLKGGKKNKGLIKDGTLKNMALQVMSVVDMLH